MLRPGAAILFLVSAAFPVAASLLPPERTPLWLGVIDVGVAFALFAVGLTVVSRRPGPFGVVVLGATLRALRLAANVLLVLLIVFFVAPAAVRWDVLLPGLAWRAWFLVLVLPSWVALGETAAAGPDAPSMPPP